MEEEPEITQSGKISHNDNDSFELPSEIEKIIEFVPAEKKEETLRILTSLTVHRESTFHGPLPPPSILTEYDSAIENGAERIMAMAERQSSHRIEIEKLAIKEELKQSGRGQLFGFILALIGMSIAFGLAYLGHDTVAGIFGTTTIIGLVTVFVIGRKQQNKDS